MTECLKYVSLHEQGHVAVSAFLSASVFLSEEHPEIHIKCLSLISTFFDIHLNAACPLQECRSYLPLTEVQSKEVLILSQILFCLKTVTRWHTMKWQNLV